MEESLRGLLVTGRPAGMARGGRVESRARLRLHSQSGGLRSLLHRLHARHLLLVCTPTPLFLIPPFLFPRFIVWCAHVSQLACPAGPTRCTRCAIHPSSGRACTTSDSSDRGKPARSCPSPPNTHPPIPSCPLYRCPALPSLAVAVVVRRVVSLVVCHAGPSSRSMGSSTWARWPSSLSSSL